MMTLMMKTCHQRARGSLEQILSDHTETSASRLRQNTMDYATQEQQQ